MAKRAQKSNTSASSPNATPRLGADLVKTSLLGVDLTVLSDRELSTLATSWNEGRLSSTDLELISNEISRRVAPPTSTELIKAVEAEDEALVARLIAAGADVQGMDLYAEVPMSVATARGNQRIVDILHEAGAPLHQGFTDAVYGGHVDLVRWMLDHGQSEDINMPLSNDLQTVLFGAAATGNLEMVRLLVEYGADVNHQDSCLSTASDSAEALGRHDVVEYLTEVAAQQKSKRRRHEP
jgi:hypothetical protein